MVLAYILLTIHQAKSPGLHHPGPLGGGACLDFHMRSRALRDRVLQEPVRSLR